MFKDVMISIHPKWCELIASGKKTVEVRKTRPKIETPFKCYIYETKSKLPLTYSQVIYPVLSVVGRGKVIGEFVCDWIRPMSITYINPDSPFALREFPNTCLTDKEIINYLGNGKIGYGWHISDLVIYDKPKELSEFYSVCPKWEKERITNKCHKCPHLFKNDSDMCYQCSVEGEKHIKRPPQSWCYVEELK